MARANADPTAVHELLASALADDDRPLSDVEAVSAWALGLALRHLRHLAEAEAVLRRASASLNVGSDDHTGAVLTLSGTLAFSGRFDEAAAVLDACSPTPTLAGRVLFQRAALAEHRGQLTDARTGYESSLESFRLSDDRLGEAHALNGVGLVRVAEANAERALADFELARLIYSELELPLLAAVARHNLGFASLRAGDTVGAMRHLAAAERDVAAFGEPFVEIGLDHVEALLVAGFMNEAIERAAMIGEAMDGHQLDADRSSMLLGLARSLGLAGRSDLAHRYLDAAASLLETQERPHWRRVVSVRQIELTGATAADLAELVRISDELRRDGQIDEAAEADLIAIDLAVRRSDRDALAASGRRLSELPPADWRRLVGVAAEAEVAGDVDRAVDAVIELLESAGNDAHDASLDLRAGLVTHRQRAIDAALRAASEADAADAIVRIVAAMQRQIVPAARGRAVRRSISDDVLDALRSEPTMATWRTLANAVRTGEPAGELDDHESAVPAIAETKETPPAVFTSTDLPVYVVADHGATVTVVRLDRKPTVVATPDRQLLLDAFRRFHTALARWSSEPATEQGARQLDDLASSVIATLPWLADDSSALAVCATGAFAGCAWAGVAARPVRLIVDLDPIEQHRRPATAPTAKQLIVAGPGLDSVDEEVERLQQVLNAPLVLAGEDATPERVAEALVDAETLHLACHATHDSTNPLLSSYQLAGGNLTGYEIDRMSRVPHIVVAAACRAGRASSQGTGMALGTATAWLSSGAETVIAPTCSIPDDKRTIDAAVGLHTSLATGLSGEGAVFALRATVDAAVARSFQTVGRLMSR